MKVLLFVFAAAVAATAAPRPVIADYASIITEATLRADGQRHLDTPAMLAALKDLHVNTYIYLVHGTLDWNDMKDEFLPAAEKAGLDVWLYFLPPSECPIETCKLPWGHDYIRLHEEAAKLSLLHKNLKGTAIDDFSDNVKLFTPEYIGKLKAAGRAIQPGFLFYPLLYTKSMNEAFLNQYDGVIDGVIWAYRDEPTINTTRNTSLRAQLTQSEALLQARGKSLILMVYCSPLGRIPIPPSADYVTGILREGIRDAKEGRLTGVVTYKLSKSATAPDEQNYARSGNARGTLLASGRDFKAGDYAELSLPITSRGETKSLTFHHMVFYSKMPPGYFFLQLLVDGQLVWEQDVNAAVSKIWQEETVNLNAVLQGKQAATLQLRLALKRNAGSNQLVAGFDDFKPQGLRISDPGFETGNGWTLHTTHPAMIPLVQKFDPAAPARMFEAVRQIYATAP